MEEQAEALARAVEEALPAWVERSVDRLVRAATEAGWTGASAAASIRARARRAGEQARAEVGGQVRALLESDIDEQRSNPLALLRAAVRYPTEVLREAGLPAVVRDEFAEERFPDDIYDLTPASFADIDPNLHQPGIEWGAAKAWAHRQRHGGGSGGAK